MSHFAVALVTVLCLSAPSTARAAEFHDAAVRFRACCKRDGLDVQRLLGATRAYCDLLSQFGKFAGPAVANVRGCIEKVEAAARRKSQSKKKLRLVRELLASESSLHEKGGKLADPSAAMGLLWMRRGLEFWADVFEQQATALGKGSKRKASKIVSLTAQCATAYRRTVEPFHGFVSRRAFNMALGLTPEWEDVCQRAGLAGLSDDALRHELLELASATRAICTRLRKAQVQLDMEDTRRSV